MIQNENRQLNSDSKQPSARETAPPPHLQADCQSHHRTCDLSLPCWKSLCSYRKKKQNNFLWMFSTRSGINLSSKQCYSYVVICAVWLFSCEAKQYVHIIVQHVGLLIFVIYHQLAWNIWADAAENKSSSLAFELHHAAKQNEPQADNSRGDTGVFLFFFKWVFL